MQRHIGVLAAEHLAVGLVEGAKVVGLLRIYPSERTQAQIQAMPAADGSTTMCGRFTLTTQPKALIELFELGYPS